MKTLDNGWNDPFEEYRDAPAGGMSGNGSAPGNTGRRGPLGWLSGIFGLCAAACFIGTFVLGFAGEAILPDGMMWLVPMAFGMTFLSAGLAVSMGSRQPGPLLFAFLGAVVAGVSIFYGLGDGAARDYLMERVVPLLALSVFVVAGAGLAVVPRVRYRQKAASHPVQVRAVVIKKIQEHWTDLDHHHHHGFKLTWKYYAGGQERVFASRMARRPEPRDVGDEGVLYLSETDPCDVWEKPSPAEAALTLVLGLSFVLAGTAAIALYLLKF